MHINKQLISVIMSLDKLINQAQACIYKHPCKDNYYFSYKNFNCYVRRNMSLAFCGYITIPNNIDLPEDMYDDMDCPITVHGNFTYCGVDDNNLKVLGFDCAHYNDFVPMYHIVFDDLKNQQLINMFSKLNELNDYTKMIYWSFDMVINEIKNVVDQIIQYQKPSELPP